MSKENIGNSQNIGNGVMLKCLSPEVVIGTILSPTSLLQWVENEVSLKMYFRLLFRLPTF